MSQILIYGVPGVGKTAVARLVAQQLGYRYTEGDSLKRQLKHSTQAQWTKVGTCQAYRYFGDLNVTNVIRGLQAVRAALQPIVTAELAAHELLVLEGAFLDPRELSVDPHLILLTTLDEAQHKRQFLSHREKLFDFQGHEFTAARIVQEYLIQEAATLPVTVIDNHGQLQGRVAELVTSFSKP